MEPLFVFKQIPILLLSIALLSHFTSPSHKILHNNPGSPRYGHRNANVLKAHPGWGFHLSINIFQANIGFL